MKKIFELLMMTVSGIAIVGLLVWVVMQLWNAILPDLTGWNAIGYWQCAGLCLMFRLMTGHIGICKRTRKRKHRHLHEMISRKYKFGNDDLGIEVEICNEKKND